jgi:Rrf2 family protein
MHLSRSAEYGLRAVLYLAIHCQKGIRFGGKTIAKDLDFPEAFLGKILQNLARKGIIYSIKGPNGGFFIEEEILNLPIIKIIEAIDGLSYFKNCGMGLHECNDEKPCPIHKEYGPLRDGFFNLLATKTIGDFKADIEAGNSFIEI